MSKLWVMFNEKTGQVGVKRLSKPKEEKDTGCNYVIDIVDPVFFVKQQTIGAVTQWREWKELDLSDDRVKFIKLFNILEEGEANWFTTEQNEEMFIENPHEVFRLVKELFK